MELLYSKFTSELQTSPNIYFSLYSSTEYNEKKEQKETIDEIVKFYGDKPPHYLVDLTHFEDPWKNARVELATNERGNNEISLQAMQDYYSSL